MEYSRVYMRFEPWILSQNTFGNVHCFVTLTSIEIAAVSVILMKTKSMKHEI